MKFRLVYDGLLESNARATQKQLIRKALHPQIKKLWAVSPHLTRQAVGCTHDDGTHTKTPWPEYMVREGLCEFKRNGYEFLPIVTSSQEVLVSVDILFLRHGAPGHVLRRADIDNRLKTLFDGLRMPRNAEELGDFQTPAEDEKPFFVVLEDDSQITQLSIETDELLSTIPGQTYERRNDARVVITIEIHPTVRTVETQYF